MAIDWIMKFAKLKNAEVTIPMPSKPEEFEAKGNSILDCAQTDVERRFRNAVNQGIDSGKVKTEKDILELWKSWQMGGSQLDEDTRQDRDDLAKLNNAILATKDSDYRAELLAKKSELEAKLFATIDN